ncbi:MAG TPA: FtsL-like putative cell division protein [Bacteroidales bacterium]|nr:FtsL-like putative cell division protein [Bacteroidales bacterium]
MKAATDQHTERKTKKRRVVFNPFRRFFYEILGGGFLARYFSWEQTKFLLFLVGIAFFYIGNSYYIEKLARENDKLNREMKELHFEYVSLKSQVMFESRQSELARKLKKTGITESIEPVQKIVVKSTDKP